MDRIAKEKITEDIEYLSNKINTWNLTNIHVTLYLIATYILFKHL